MPGSHIAPVLYKDGDAEGGAFDSYLETGGNTYETKAEDFNYYDANMNRITRDDANFKEYMMPGEYNVINIMFPEQPELEAYSAYRLGYELVDGFFAVAGQNNNYVHHYDGDPDSVLYYVYYSYDTLLDGTVNVLKKYGNTFHPGNRLNSNVIDPEDGYIRQGSSSLPPMIRMLVGPRASYPTFRVNVECEGFEGLEGSGVYHANGATSVCGTTVNMTVGSAGSYVHAEAEPGYVVMAVIVDGDTAYKYGDGETGTDPNATHGTSSGYDLVNYDLSGAAENANITVKVIVGEEPYDEGIDEVASKVKMNLYPNPANNNVQLSIAGVSGNVNCAILDMSGRVVYNQTINAETTNNINLSSLAKGAYFVRITNKDFTKVEKLIVR